MEKTYGIIGAGMMGREHMRNIALLDGARVTAIAEPDAEQKAHSLELLGEGACAYPDHRAMLAAEELDALVIAAPNHRHLPILRDVLRTEIPVLCEKPLGLSDAECAEIEALQARRTAALWVAMEYRYMPAVARLIEAVRAGTAGDVRMLTIREHRFPFLDKVGNWNRFNAQSGGTLVEKCCHFFDLMRLILQAEPVRVFASGGMDVNFLDEDYAGQRPDVLDNAYVIVDFDTGQRAMLDLCMFAEGAEWQEEISVAGTLARMDARVPGPARFAPGGLERHGEFATYERATKCVARETVETDPRILRAGDHHGSTYFQHEGFLSMLNGGAGPAVTVNDGRIAVAVGAAAEESVRTGLPVVLAGRGEQAMRA